MPSITTRQFGIVEYDDDAVIEFPYGLPAFEHERRFLRVERPANAPIVFFQSLSAPELSFAAAPVSAIDTGYELEATEEDLEIVGGLHPGLGAYALLTFHDDGAATANLLAPVLVNPLTRRAVQAVRCDARYSHRHPLGGGPSCS